MLARVRVNYWIGATGNGWEGEAEAVPVVGAFVVFEGVRYEVREVEPGGDGETDWTATVVLPGPHD